jgi:aspartate racemase
MLDEVFLIPQIFYIFREFCGIIFSTQCSLNKQLLTPPMQRQNGDRMKTIGIMGGMGPMATVDLMQKVIVATKAIKDQEHIHSVIDNNTNIPDRSECIFGKGPSPVPEMVKSAERLTAMGADVIIIGCNTAHYFLPEVQKQVKTPFINMIEETAKFCAEEGYRTLGLLASAGTCASGIYKKEFEKLGMTLLNPEEAEQEIIHEMIYDGVKATNYNYDAAPAQNVLRAMEQRGVEAFILGCTEVPVAVQMYKLQGCFVDATEVLAEKAVAWAGGEVISSLPRRSKK